MRWDDLHFFLAVARSGQYARAARTLDVDPTTVGRRLRRLERSLGIVLFETTRDGQSLTGAGTELLERVEAMAEIAGAIAPGGSPGDAVSGIVRLSVAEGFGTWFVARHLAGFAARHPSIGIDLVASSGFLSPSRGETDVAILLARPRAGPLVTRKLTDYRLRLYAATDYLVRHDPIENAAQLRSHLLIGYIPDFIYAPELRYLNEIAPGLEPHLRSSSINAQYCLTASGAGIAVLPCFMGDADPTLRPILPEVSITRSFWLVTHQHARSLTRIRLFVDWLVATTEQHRGGLMGSRD